MSNSQKDESTINICKKTHQHEVKKAETAHKIHTPSDNPSKGGEGKTPKEINPSPIPTLFMFLTIIAMDYFTWTVHFPKSTYVRNPTLGHEYRYSTFYFRPKMYKIPQKVAESDTTHSHTPMSDTQHFDKHMAKSK